MSKKQIAQYPHFREITSDVTINCYTGGVASLLKAQGKEVPEYVIWTLGKGFEFIEHDDEYGDPEISFDLFNIINKFSKVYQCKLDKEAIDEKNLREQLKFNLKQYPLLVWVNSKYMSYSDLYYSSNGYLHAIVLKSFGEEKDLVRVRDNLIVSMPPWSCNADLHYDDLLKGLTDRVKSSTIDVMGYLHKITIENDTTLITAKLLRDSLYEESSEIVENFDKNRSVIIKYGEHCCKHIENCDDEKKLWMLRRINDNIKTLYVLPNRILLGEVLKNLDLKADDYDNLKNKLDKVLEEWTTLSNLCLKCFVSQRMRELSMLPSCFEKVKDTEQTFWKELKVVLGGYDGQ